MKHTLRGLLVCISVFMVLLCLLTIPAYAQEQAQYRLYAEGDAYALSELRADGEYVLATGTLPLLVERLRAEQQSMNNCTVQLDALVTDSTLTLRDLRARFVGSLTLCGTAQLVIEEGADITLADVSVRFGTADAPSDGFLRIKGGTLTVDGAQIIGGTRYTVCMDHASSAALVMHAGCIRGTNTYATIHATRGTVRLLGGTVENTVANAIYSSASLYLGGMPTVRGVGEDILTEGPLWLTSGGVPFGGDACIRYRTLFEKGQAAAVLYAAVQGSEEHITLLDRDGVAMPLMFMEQAPFTDERAFLAVYRPFTVTYVAHGNTLSQSSQLSGESIRPPIPPSQAGYTFEGWFADAQGSVPFDGTVRTDMTLFAVYRLTPPSFAISSLAFTYDGTSRPLVLDSLEHPLLDTAVLSYAWEKDGTPLSAVTSSLPIRTVADSGAYCLHITLTVGADTVTVTTPAVNVCVLPRQIPPPTLAASSYTGTYQSAAPSPSPWYTVTSTVGGVHVGQYPVTLQLTDPQNTVWQGGDAQPLTLVFSITRAENVFTTPPAVANAFAGQMPSVTFATLFGEGYCLFASSPDGPYSADVPVDAGSYYVRVCVDATEDHTALLSDALPFELLDVRPEALRLLRLPDKTNYTAFDAVSLLGAQIALVMNDGSEQLISHDLLTIMYTNSKNSLRFGDAFVFACYGDLILPIPVSVRKANFDMTGVGLPDTTVTFDGRVQSIPVLGVLPTGPDGGTLTVTYEGGGRDVGQYTVIARFTPTSDQYDAPAPISATLTVEARTIRVQWGCTDFVYNTSAQLPTATAPDIDGMPLPLSITGQGCSAGSYTAVCSSQDGNYIIENPTISFTIAKASYDMRGVYWSSESFVYTGSPHTVTLMGLPSGVEVVGYTDATATTVGRYTAACTLSYDAQNYEPPSVPSHTYTITPAMYDMSAVRFPETVRIYNGNLQFPEQQGTLPIGADGSCPVVHFDCGATHVTDGTVTVTVHFESTSDNYLPPVDITTTVTIAPLLVSVSWGATSFVYSGERYVPRAVCDACPVTVSGGAVDAGSYIAYAHATDPDYTVTNATCTFAIDRAPNAWRVTPTHPDAFEGYPLLPSAEALDGDIHVTYYADAALTHVVDTPKLAGVYYAVTQAIGARNYEDIASAPLRFSIIAVTPTSMTATRTDTPLVALSPLGAQDVILTLNYNDGTSRPLSLTEVTVTYERGDCLHGTDTRVSFCYAEWHAMCEVQVARISVPVPQIPAAVYNGVWQAAAPAASELYTIVENAGGCHSGTYPVGLQLCDPDNYVFANGDVQLTLPFEVMPLALTVQVEDVCIYLDTKSPDIRWHIQEGKLVDGDALSPVFSVADGILVATCQHPDYDVTFSVGRVVYTGTLSPGARRVSYLIGILFLLILFGVLLRTRENARRRLYALVQNTLPQPFVPVPPPTVTEPMPTTPEHPPTEASATLLADAIIGYIPPHAGTAPPQQTPVFVDPSSSEAETSMLDASADDAQSDSCPSPLAVDVAHADRLLSDKLAARLVDAPALTVQTHGRRKVIINVGALNRAFDAGERVDVNALKDRYLVPYDTGYLKVLADGYLDRALEVYADSFSLQAVKMIALTGGHAYRVVTVPTDTRKKHEKNPEKH